MSRLTTSFVLGYHGCDRKIGEKALRGKLDLLVSTEPYHWLGSGVYFWEADPVRAMEWAKQKQARDACDDPFVIGAVIDLRNCLDLMVRENLELLSEAYTSFSAAREKSGLKMPANKKAKHDQSEDMVLRFLDCAIIDHLCAQAEAAGSGFESVRGIFVEGGELFPGSKIQKKTHSEIAVRDTACIRGLFRA